MCSLRYRHLYYYDLMIRCCCRFVARGGSSRSSIFVIGCVTFCFELSFRYFGCLVVFPFCYDLFHYHHCHYYDYLRYRFPLAIHPSLNRLHWHYFHCSVSYYFRKHYIQMIFLCSFFIFFNGIK